MDEDVSRDATILIPGAFVVDEKGLVVIGQPSFKVWSGAMRQASRLVRGTGFLMGDLILWGEDHFGEEASQAIDAGSWDERRVGVYAWLSRQIPRERRRLHLFPRGGIDHHLAVAHLAPDEQVAWLEKAAEEDWTVKEIRQHLSAAGKTKKQKPTIYPLEVDCRTQQERESLRTRLVSEGYLCRVISCWVT